MINWIQSEARLMKRKESIKENNKNNNTITI